jgi:hypothetical protein
MPVQLATGYFSSTGAARSAIGAQFIDGDFTEAKSSLAAIIAWESADPNSSFIKIDDCFALYSAINSNASTKIVITAFIGAITTARSCWSDDFMTKLGFSPTQRKSWCSITNHCLAQPMLGVRCQNLHLARKDAMALLRVDMPTNYCSATTVRESARLPIATAFAADAAVTGQQLTVRG